MTRGKAALWTIAIGSSAVLLALVIAQIDVRAARELVRATDYGWVAAGIAMLLVEGVVTALRFRLLARGAVRLRDSLLATAWYVLMLIGLPARLGEIAGIGVDTGSVDPGKARGFPVHGIVNGSGHFHLENLADLSGLPESGAYLIVAPIKIEGGSGGQVRVFGVIL